MTTGLRLLAASFPLLLLASGCVSTTPIKQVAAAEPIQAETQQKKRPIQFKKIVMKVKRGDEIGTVHVGLLNIAQEKMYWRKSNTLNFSDDDFTDRFREELQAANYEVVGNPDALFDDPSEWKAELLVAGVIKDLKMNAYFPLGGLGNYSKSRGTAYLQVEWQIFSRLERKVVLTLSTEGSVEQKKAVDGGLEGVLGDAFSVAIKNLLGEKSFFDLVVSS